MPTVLTIIVQKLFLISSQRVLIQMDYLLGSEVTMEYTVGMENFAFAQYMLESNRGSILTGSSVHNSSVERALRDVCSGVLCFFSRTFTELEDSGILDPLYDVHIHTLCKVFIPLINRSLVISPDGVCARS